MIFIILQMSKIPKIMLDNGLIRFVLSLDFTKLLTNLAILCNHHGEMSPFGMKVASFSSPKILPYPSLNISTKSSMVSKTQVTTFSSQLLMRIHGNMLQFGDRETSFLLREGGSCSVMIAHISEILCLQLMKILKTLRT